MSSALSGDSTAGGERFPRRSRIRLGKEIRALLSGGERHRSSGLELFTAPSPIDLPRFGTVVPKYGRTVVERNLLRRRLREIGRTEVLPSLRRRSCLADVLVRTRPQAYETSYSDLRTQLLRLTERLCSDASL